MPSQGAVLQGAVFVLAGLFATTAVAGAVAPALAPDVMTMRTMTERLGVPGYEDDALCDFWVTNMSQPTERIQRSFPCSFRWDWSTYDGGDAYVHEVLWDKERDEVFTVPNMDRGTMQEWYHVDGHMLTPNALTFQRAEGGGVLMPPPHRNGTLNMGWVESGGEKGGEERVVVPRNLQAQGTVLKDGVPVTRWTSIVHRQPARWHGYDMVVTEEVEMFSDPRTAWVLQMDRRVLVEMTPGQMADAFGVPAPDAGGEPQPIMELRYRTTPQAVAIHGEETRFFQTLMTPIEEADVMWRVGAVGAGTLVAVGLLLRLTRELLGSGAGAS